MTKLNKINAVFCILIFSLLFSCILSKSSNLRKASSFEEDSLLPEEKNFYPTSYVSDDTYKSKVRDETLVQTVALVDFSYIVYIILCLYMICAMNKYTDNPQVITKEIWKFMYLTNNGYLFISVAFLMIARDDNDDEYEKMAWGFLLANLAIFVIGSIVFMVKSCGVWCEDCLGTFFSFESLGSLFSLPCTFVWGLLGVTDPCCMQTTYTVTTYADGHTESNECCVRLCNCTVYLLKRLAMLVSTIIYYGFIIVLTIVWFILKAIISLILLLVLCTCGRKLIQPDPEPANQNNNQQENLVQNTPPPLEMNQNQITLTNNVEPAPDNYTGGGDIYNNNVGQYPDLNQPQQAVPNNYY